MLLFYLVAGILQWQKNNNSPQISVPARVVAKRMRHSRAVYSGTYRFPSATNYYVTFELDSGNRQEFSMSVYEFRQIEEGDEGILTYQGTRFLRFDNK
jgi:hypothetical protein